MAGRFPWQAGLDQGGCRPSISLRKLAVLSTLRGGGTCSFSDRTPGTCGALGSRASARSTSGRRQCSGQPTRFLTPSWRSPRYTSNRQAIPTAGPITGTSCANWCGRFPLRAFPETSVSRTSTHHRFTELTRAVRRATSGARPSCPAPSSPGVRRSSSGPRQGPAARASGLSLQGCRQPLRDSPGTVPRCPFPSVRLRHLTPMGAGGEPAFRNVYKTRSTDCARPPGPR